MPAKTEFGHKIEFQVATPDMSHLAVSSAVHLNAEPAATGANLYEWSAGQFKLINVLPNETPAAGASLGFGKATPTCSATRSPPTARATSS